MMKFRMYVDEVGNPDLDSSDNPNHRFLSLTGIVTNLDFVGTTLHPQLEALKIKYFSSHPDDPIILHRKEMVNHKPPFHVLADPNIRNAFDLEFLHFLRMWEYSVITVCIDKKVHKETYSVWRYDPYHYCLQILLERFYFVLSKMEAVGDVMAESRGGKEDMRLKSSFHRLYEKGTDYIAPERIQKALTSKELKVKPKSANVSGLQIADILAHPSRCEILYSHKLLGRELGPFAVRVIEILQDKYYRDVGKIYGKKFI